MKANSHGAAIWLVANLVGAGIFLLVASQFWVDPDLREFPGSTVGDPIIWGLTALPIWFAFVVLNIGLAALAYFKRVQLQLAKCLWITIPIWLVAFVVDQTHH